MKSIYKYLLDTCKKKGAGHIVLIDPDRKNHGSIELFVELVNKSGADAIFVGGSLMMDGKFHERVSKIKALSEVPVIFFPGGANQLNEHYDAILFMSLLSGRNPQFLIGEQVISAPIIKDLKIETIPTGYLLLDGGGESTVTFMSASNPIPIHRADIAEAHALAAQYLGMKLVYLEAGSGAKRSVPATTIQSVSQAIEIPVIVGGGIRTPESAEKRVLAGADFIVTGTVLEAEKSGSVLQEIASAVHTLE
jgi:phosphoglycerol geranylgeranyltransferase